MGTTLKVTAKGQVTLRKELLDHLGVEPGDKIVVDSLPSGRAEARAARPKATIDDFIGCLRRPGGPTLSIDEINEIAAAGWAGKA
ncbi:MAG TPA: AbrB/MazE/SpoVT family DNA-binding domain-containing protein [Acetobacteraceae bacterium]|nr:AbrB/MazE/SpoVT family DNA-binding domain-containing protein [Acetobacteraceae bacterium]